MAIQTKNLAACLFGILSVVLLSPPLALAWVAVADEPERHKLAEPFFANNKIRILAFADSTLECGLYYQYTAGGMRHNPNISHEIVRSISQNAAALLETADLIYTAAGISTADKREALMQRARTVAKERQYSGTTFSDLIYEYAEKCRQLMTIYPSALMTIEHSMELY